MNAEDDIVAQLTARYGLRSHYYDKSKPAVFDAYVSIAEVVRFVLTCLETLGNEAGERHDP